MKMVGIKLYGARRTGTNWIYRMLVENFVSPVFISVLGWKHGPPPEDLQKWWEENPKDRTRAKHAIQFIDRLRYVICIKDPYAMVLSNLDYSVRFFKKKIDFSNPAHYKPLCRGFNELYECWWKFMDKEGRAKCTVFRYEVALSDFRATLRIIEAQFSLKRKQPGPLRPFDKEALPGTDGAVYKSKQDFDRAAYYLEAKFMDRLNDECRQAITDAINWDVMGRYGYGPSA